MSKLPIRQMLWWLIPLGVTLIAVVIAVSSSLSADETHYLPARLATALIVAVFSFIVGWLTRRRVTREMIFGLAFVILGLFILTTPLRLLADQYDAVIAGRVIDAVLVKVTGEGETIHRSDAASLIAQTLKISDSQADNLLSSLSDIGNANPISFKELEDARTHARATASGANVFSPDAASGLRYGEASENAPVTHVPTGLWLFFTAFSFLIGGLLSLFLPPSINEKTTMALTGLGLLIPLPLVGSVLLAAITILERTLGVIPEIVWWVIGFAAYLGGMGALTYFNRQRENIIQTTWITICFVLLVPTVLIVVAVGKDTNVLTILAESLRLATPIVIGAIAGIWSERAGVVNIAIEGMLLTGACIGFTALTILQPLTGNNNWALFLSVLIAIASGGLMALLHAWLSIRFKTNQIISGTVINILALGLTGYIRRKYLLTATAGRLTLPQVPIPGLVSIPLIGPVLFDSKPIFYLMFVLLVATYYVIFHTSWGLRIRAVGEHPHAADTVGINVYRVRYLAVLVGGLVAGLGGAWFTLETSGSFDDNMTSGRGFIALAAMIFGKWTPFGAFFGGLLFGFADALGTRFQILDIPIPPQFMQILPYVVTMLVLAGFVGRARAPAADGVPYEK